VTHPDVKKAQNVKQLIRYLFAGSWFLLATSGVAAGTTIGVESLRCEFRTEPAGIDVPHPRLSWAFQASAVRNLFQQAYRLQVASTPGQLTNDQPNLWDTGKIASASSQNVPYGGRKIPSNTTVYWRVKVWDTAGHETDWSATASWHTGLLPEDWVALWIQDSKPHPRTEQEMFDDHAAPQFRREFMLEKPVAAAWLYVSGLGYYEASLNGKKVGDHVLDPGWTNYDKRILYNTFDVTRQLKEGRNCAGVVLGNGWFNPLPLRMWGRINLREALPTGAPMFIFQLEIAFTDGSRQRICSSQAWKAADGPILANNIYLGEKYDAGKVLNGWNTAGYDDNTWRSVTTVSPPAGVMQAQAHPPVKIREEIRPVKVWTDIKGRTLVDMGVNFGGIVRLRASGKRGDVIRMRYGELLYADSTLNVMTSVAGQLKGTYGQRDTAYQKDVFILSGTGSDTFQPTFTFHGFRYVEIKGYPGTLTADDITGLRLSADVDTAGVFTCSNPLFNAIQRATQNTFLSNLYSVQSDCPHRERFGYGGDMAATSEAMMYNFDMAAFYEKAVRDYADAARPNGGFTETSPFVGIADDGLGQGAGPVAWGTVHPLLLAQRMQYYGDTGLVREQYDAAVRWFRLLQDSAENFVLASCIGDHESLEPKSVALTTTAFFYQNATLMAKLACALKKRGDEQRFLRIAQEIKKAFMAKFGHPGTGMFDTHTQANQSIALAFNLVPEAEREKAIAVLLDEIVVKQKGHVATGMFGTKYMLDQLGYLHHARLACDMIGQKTFPGWGYMIEHGATSIWEHWAYSDNVYSHNHPMWGSVSEFFFKHILGIQAATDASAFDKITVAPQMDCGLQWAKGYYRAPAGTVSVWWQQKDNGYALQVDIPANTKAIIHLPAKSGMVFTEGGRPIASQYRVEVAADRQTLTLETGSGHYEFAGVQAGDRD